LPFRQVLLDNQRHIVQSEMRVPNTFWIDDGHWAMPTLIEATAIVDPDFAFQSGFSN
jgi:hypothetical protein